MERKQDETIRELFQQLKVCDERDVPSFLSTLDSVQNGSPDIGKRSLGWWAFATIAAVVALAVFSLYEISSRNHEVAIATPPMVQPPAAFATPGAVIPLPVLTVAPKTRTTRVRSDRLPRGSVMAKWRSPTEFLLPGQEGIKAFPRLDESLIKIRPPMQGLSN